MNYSLPKKLAVCGSVYDIRYDFRCILDIISAMEDPELSNQEKAFVAVSIFYPDFSNMPSANYQEAVERCFWFINGGREQLKNSEKRLVCWEQDFQHILPAVNRVIGHDVREVPYDETENTGGLHWWVFLAAYLEIGECMFSQIVRIRDLKSRGKKLDKAEEEWYQRNRHLVDFQQTFTEAEEEVLSRWGVK